MLVTGHFVHPWHFVHPDIWSTWTFGLKTTRTPWHIVPRQLVYPDILSKDNSYTLTFHTPYFVMSWLKYQRVYQMSWTFRTPFPFSFVNERVYQMSWTFRTPFYYRFLTERVYQMSWTFGTPFPCSLLAPDIWYTRTFGTPGHFVHPDIWYTRTFGTPRHLVHPFLIGFLLKGCTKCPWHLVHPFLTGKRVYEMSGCTKWYWTTCQGVPNVRVYQMSVDLLSGYQMSGCTKCQGVPNVIGVPNVM